MGVWSKLTDWSKSPILKGVKSAGGFVKARGPGAAKAAGKGVLGAGKVAGKGVLGAGKVAGLGTVAAGGVVAGGTLGAIGAVGGMSPGLYFAVAMMFHFFVDGFTRFQTSPVIRFGFYFGMFMLGWLIVFKPSGVSPVSREGMRSMFRSFMLAFLAFFMPYIANLSIFRDVLGQSNIDIFLAIMPVYLVYFFFIDPDAFGEDSKWLYARHIYIIIFIIIFANWAFHAGRAQVQLGTLEFIPGLEGVNQANILGVWGDIFEMVWDTIKSFFKWLWEWRTNFRGKLGALFNSSISPEVFTGQTDPNAKQKLGVRIDKLQATDKNFFVGDPVGVFATLVANTFDKPIVATISCAGQSGKAEKKDEYDVKVDRVYPSTEYVFEDFSQEEIDCVFEHPEFLSGGRKVKMSVDFDFETQAYYKTYFVDRERARALRRNNQNILDVFKVGEKDPKAIFTDGPLQIGMGIGKPQPVELDINNPVTNRMTLGITIKNRWEGYVRRMNKLAIMMPRELKVEGDSCGHVLEDGNCKDMNVICDDQQYRVYKVKPDTDGIVWKDLKSFKSLRCPITISSGNLLLGNTPLITEFFRVNAEYEYLLEKSTTLTIKDAS